MNQLSLKDKISIKDTKDKDIRNYRIEIPEQQSSFRLGLLAKYKDPQKEVSFTIQELDLADPCIEEQESRGGIMCSGKEQSESCTRNSPVDGFQCNCIAQHNGLHCEVTDWCHEHWDIFGQYTGEEFCIMHNSGNCFVNQNDQYECDCSEDKSNSSYFDRNEKKCLPVPKCLTHQCKANEKCVESETPDSDPLCKCIEPDYVNLSTDPKQPKCEKFNPCDDTHNKVKGLPENPCGEFTCKPVDSNYMCLCKDGSYDVNHVLNKQPTCTTVNKCNPLFNTCEQKCIDDGVCDCYTEYYDKKDNKCVLKTGKECKHGDGAFCKDGGALDCKEYYTFNQTDCIPDESIFNSVFNGKEYLCFTGKAKSENNKLVCDCGKNMHYDNTKKQCVIDPICSQGGSAKAECDKKNALCLIDATDISKNECRCADGTRWFNDSKTICVDVCEYEDRQSNCESINAYCNPIKSANTNSEDTAKFDKYCDCNVGFEMKPWTSTSQATCNVNDMTQKFTLSLKLQTSGQSTDNGRVYIDPMKERAGYDTYTIILDDYRKEIDGIKKANLEFIKNLKTSLTKDNFATTDTFGSYGQYIINQIYPKVSTNPQVLKCSPGKDDFYDCIFTFNHITTTVQTDFTKLLGELCKPLPGHDDLCFIKKSTTYLYSAITPFEDDNNNKDIVTINKKDLANTAKLEFINHCESNNNICDHYSYCEQPKDSSHYKCRCNLDDFDEKSAETKFDIETKTCTIKKEDIICKKCAANYEEFKKSGTCYIGEPSKDGDKPIVVPQCICQKKFKAVNDDKHNLQCVDVCHDKDCNSNGECKYNEDSANGWQCVCNEGFYGDECKDEHSLSKAGWIAGIVVLAVLVVVISGVAFMFARRSRSSSGDYSGRPMEEYSSSYRVPSGGAQARGQSNPGFHRD